MPALLDDRLVTSSPAARYRVCNSSGGSPVTNPVVARDRFHRTNSVSARGLWGLSNNRCAREPSARDGMGPSRSGCSPTPVRIMIQERLRARAVRG